METTPSEDEEHVPNSCKYHMTDLATFTPCCIVCKRMRWTDILECTVSIDYSDQVGWAMTCDNFERIKRWADVGMA